MRKQKAQKKKAHEGIGYEWAKKVDEYIDNLISLYPISQNSREYLAFARTVRSSCDIIGEEALKIETDVREAQSKNE